jgi:hypothetical protein
VTLNSNNELEILLGLLGVDGFIEESLPNSIYFSNVIDLSQFKFPELSIEEFDELYESWLSKTARESSMDEYGQLIFIQGQAQKWNQRRNKVVLCERP